MEAAKTAEIVTLPMPRRNDVAGAIDKVDTNTMGGRLRFARLRKGIRQEDVAKALGKARATVVQYEKNAIVPPTRVVDDLAEIVGVSPSFLAYGEQTVPVYGRDIDVVSGPEYRIGKNGAAPVSGFSLSRDLVESFGAEDDKLHAYVLNHDAPEFGFRSGDRLFVNIVSQKPDGEHDLYLLNTGNGIEVVRVEPNFSTKVSGQVKMTGPKGQPITANLKELRFIGSVVASLRRQ